MSDPTSSQETADRNAGPARWWVLLAVGFLTCLVASVFWPIPGFEFVNFDVKELLVDNPHVRGLTAENLKHIFTSRCVTSYYPVRTLTFALDYQLWGMNPGAFKLTNGLVHLANVLLVFWLILRLFRHPAVAGVMRRPVWDVSVAAFSAGLFAMHPVVVEPVTWVPGREELLMTLGALACFHFHLTARRLEADRKTWAAIAYFGMAAFCCTLACLSNGVAAAIPLVVTACDLLLLERARLRRVFCGTWALWVIGVATIVIKRTGDTVNLFGEETTAAVRLFERLGYTGDLVLGEVGAFSAERLLLVANVYWLNLKSVFWPTDLGIFYGPAQPRSMLETGVVLGGWPSR